MQIAEVEIKVTKDFMIGHPYKCFRIIPKYGCIRLICPPTSRVPCLSTLKGCGQAYLVLHFASSDVECQSYAGRG
jgi:hypothetical protein